MGEPEQIDTAVDKVQMLLTRAYGFIRSQVCDQVELFAESFFKLPMLRRLEEDMSLMACQRRTKQTTRHAALGWMMNLARTRCTSRRSPSAWTDFRVSSSSREHVVLFDPGPVATAPGNGPLDSSIQLKHGY